MSLRGVGDDIHMFNFIKQSCVIHRVKLFFRVHNMIMLFFLLLKHLLSKAPYVSLVDHLSMKEGWRSITTESGVLYVMTRGIPWMQPLCVRNLATLEMVQRLNRLVQVLVISIWMTLNVLAVSWSCSIVISEAGVNITVVMMKMPG